MRGKNLDRELENILAEMLAKQDMISRPALQKRLNLSSRSTLGGKRAEIIQLYRDKQLKQLDASDSQYHRLSLVEKCKKLTEDKKILQKQVDELSEKLQMIAVNSEKYGLSPEKIFEPLAPKRR